MAPDVVYLPDGQLFTAQPVFGGLFFKSNDVNNRHTPFPAGWTVVLHTEVSDEASDRSAADGTDDNLSNEPRRTHIHPYKSPTLQNDTIFISSISSPSSEDFEPAKSPSRQIALMLWISLYWYFQQKDEPSPYLDTPQSKYAPVEARPKGDWRIRIRREGVLHSRNMIPKLERMGLISTLDSSVGTSVTENSEGWDQMYVTRQSFWQIPFGLFLFSLQPRRHGSHPGSPMSSRPTSPNRAEGNSRGHHVTPSSFSLLTADVPGSTVPIHASTTPAFPISPYYSASHLPTYYPPAPLQYVMTDGVRHPVRSKPPRMGEIFYSRYIPSVAKYLSFRVASASTKPVPYLGPVGGNPREHDHLMTLSDTALIQMWLSNPRVSKFWGEYHPNFVTNSLKMKHSFPAIAMWDGVPFGYCEIYWVKEDVLGKYTTAGDFDRGIHIFIGEEWARGKIPHWLSSLMHWIWQADNRTTNICMEPRIDNERFIQSLEKQGFCKDRQIAFPHKQAWLVRLTRDTWTAPSL